MGIGLWCFEVNAAIGKDPPPLLCPFGPRDQLQAGDRGDAGERLSTKTEGGNSAQVIDTAHLAGGVAIQCQRQILLEDAVAVVTYPHQPLSPLLDIDPDAGGTGIDTVLQ